MNLEDIRKQIDTLDNEIKKLLDKRLDLSLSVAMYKKLNDEEIENRKREEEILENISNGDYFYPESISSIYESIFRESRNLQNRTFEDIRKYIGKIRDFKENIILVGMPGSGKSSIGKLLSEITGKKLADTDKVIEEKTGNSPEYIITEYGEEYFREIESEVLEEVLEENGQIVATGGGIVIFEKNRELLKQQGNIVFVDRDIEKLDVRDKPHFKDISLYDLFEKRRKLYEDVLKHIVVNNNLFDAVYTILKIYGE